MEPLDQEREPTPQEIAAHQERLIARYKEQIKFLKVEKEYQGLVTDIEEMRVRYVRAQIMIANAMAPPPPAPQEEPEGPVDPEDPGPTPPEKIVPPHERKLRREAHVE